jgi:hypothetical protein
MIISLNDRIALASYKGRIIYATRRPHEWENYSSWVAVRKTADGKYSTKQLPYSKEQPAVEAAKRLFSDCCKVELQQRVLEA